MTDEDRRLLSLAAVFAPADARALAARLSVPASDGLLEEAALAAKASRRERLAALAASLAPSPVAVQVEAVEALAAEERPRPAAALRAFRDGAGERRREHGASTLARLLLERLARLPG